MKRVLWSICLILSVPTLAISAPTAEETRSVLDHYWNGDTPVLVEYKLCSEIVREGAEKNNCAAEVNPDTVKEGDQLYLWMNYMVPQDTDSNISILIARNGRPERTKDLKVTGSLRYRTWVLLPTDKAGPYSVQVDHELNDNFTTLSKMTYNVNE